jgi:hypothetical protein
MSERFEHFEKRIENSTSQMENIHSNFRPSDIPDAEKISQRAGEGDNVKQGEWVDTGIHDVPLSKIDQSDSPVKGIDDFKKVPYPEMVRGFHTLETEVRPALENGANTDDFRAMDKKGGLEYSKGVQRVYESFYGQDSIRLEKVGDSYKVINGYHRLYVANELKISTVPARVIEKQL